MKRFLIYSLFLFSISLYGQDNTVKQARKFFVGVNFSPDYCNRILTKSKNDKNIPDSTWTQVKNFLDSIEVAKFGFTAGLAFGYQFNDILGIETGIQFSNKGYKTVPLITAYSVNFDKGALATINYSYTYLDFPLRANLTLLNKRRLNIMASVGMVFNYLVQEKFIVIPVTPTTDFSTMTFTGNMDYRKFNLSPTISTGVNYKINGRLFLRAEPIFRYGLFDIDKNTGRQLYNFGLNFGFYMVP